MILKYRLPIQLIKMGFVIRGDMSGLPNTNKKLTDPSEYQKKIIPLKPETNSNYVAT